MTPEPTTNDLDVPADELRRRLRDTQRAHDEAMPVVTEGLRRAFDPEGGATTEERRALLGLPDRRGFFRIGGLAVAASAVLVACTNPDKKKEVIAETGTLVPTSTTSSTVLPATSDEDATFVLTAISIEWLASATYTAAIDAGWLPKGAFADLGDYFRGQHDDHAGRLTPIATSMGQKPTTEPNAFLKKTVVDPEVEKIKALTDPAAQTKATVKLALELESAAAQTYTKAAGLLSQPSLRAAMTSIGGIEARHYAVLAGILDQPPAPFALEPTGGAAPKEALVAPTSPVTPYTPPATSPSSTTTTRAAR